MSYFKFIRTKAFFLHVTLAMLTGFLILYLFYKLAGMYTQHGITVDVPDFNGQSVFKLDDLVKDKKIAYRIIDSIYDPKLDAGIIIRQDPEKGSKVKEGRIIYLYVTSVSPPMIQMPKLVDRSLRQAIAMIESYGLRPGNMVMIPDPSRNLVLKQLYKGKEIIPGTRIKKGSVIDLVIGKGTTNETVSLPNCVGMTFEDAKNKLLASSLQLGTITVDGHVVDTAQANVYKQRPSAGEGMELSSGSKVDLFITDDESKLNEQKKKKDDDK